MQNNKDHFEYIRSYAPYDNIEKKKTIPIF